jgi:hypothetical protein
VLWALLGIMIVPKLVVLLYAKYKN